MKTLQLILAVARENPLYVYVFCFALIAFLLVVVALVSTIR